MHELYAQADITNVGTLVWHAVCPDRSGVSLCGLHLDPRPAAGEADAGDGETLDRYCSSCMDAIRSAMASAKDRQHAG
jgi:hypothetical protein